jgi:hypothetical protein
VRSQSIVLQPEHALTFGHAPTMAASPSHEDDAPPLRPLHKIWVVVATLVTLGVWTTVVALALESQ